MSESEIGVIGVGAVGRAVYHTLSFYYKCVGYDRKGGYHTWNDVLDTKVVFICVPTDEKNGRLDCSIVEEVISKLNDDGYTGAVVVKSTLRVGFMDGMKKKYPNLRLLYMPEFLREKSNFVWFVNPDRLVYSGDQKDIEEVSKYFTWVEGAKVLCMSYIDAEIGKLAHNAYIATKVSFTNEIERICAQHGANAYNVMSIIWADRRVGNSEHLKPLGEPYVGKCVPKDTLELMNCTGSSLLLRAVEEVNKSVKGNIKASLSELIETKQPEVATKDG